MSGQDSWDPGTDAIPIARVVRQGSRPVPAPSRPLREHLMQVIAPIQPKLRGTLAVLIGLWPLVVIVGFITCLLWTAGHHGAP